MALVAVAQAVATVSFQTVANNRIITPSIMGFESLYRVVQTTTVYLFGVAGLVAIQGVGQFALQVLIMVALAVLLYGWLLSGRYGNLQIMLLVGIVIGAASGRSPRSCSGCSPPASSMCSPPGCSATSPTPILVSPARDPARDRGLDPPVAAVPASERARARPDAARSLGLDHRRSSSSS